MSRKEDIDIGICERCGVCFEQRLVLHNIPENCEKIITFTYMEVGQSMHFECYLEHVIEEILKDLKK